MIKNCKKENCNEPSIARGKYCERHRTHKKPVRERLTDRIGRPVDDDFARILNLSRISFLEQQRQENEIKQREIEEYRIIKEEQEREYLEAIKKDEQLIQKKREEEENLQIKIEKVSNLEKCENVFYTIKIILPNDLPKLVKRFEMNAKMNDIFDTIEVYFYKNKVDIKNFILVMNYPIRKFSRSEELIKDNISNKQFILFLENLES